MIQLVMRYVSAFWLAWCLAFDGFLIVHHQGVWSIALVSGCVIVSALSTVVWWT